jgi:hypothetical protein
VVSGKEGGGRGVGGIKRSEKRVVMILGGVRDFRGGKDREEDIKEVFIKGKRE